MAHDVRAPLRAIDGYSSLLEEALGDRAGDEELGWLQSMRSASHRMDGLIDDLLTLVRVSRAQLNRSEFDLADVVSEVSAELHRRYAKRKVRVDVEGALPANADVEFVRIALRHLLTNAWKYTRERECGHVRVGVRDCEQGRAFFVADDGVGFDCAQSGQLFKMPYRLHAESAHEGTGIGLPTVRRIIERHGGRIWAEAEPDHGATFFFTLDPSSGGADATAH